MAPAMMDCTGWETALEQAMQRTAIKDEQIFARETAVPHVSDEEDKHGIVWIPAAPASFRASGTFFSVRVEDGDVSGLKLHECFFQDVTFRNCEIDGLTLKNCQFENVTFEDCFFHDVDLHNICLYDVVCRGVIFTNYTWMDDKVFGEELKPDPAKGIISGCRFGRDIPSNTSDPDWILRTRATAVAPAESDEALARRLQDEFDSENWNVWEEQSSAWMDQPQHDSGYRNAETRKTREDYAIECQQYSRAEDTGKAGKLDRGVWSDTAPATAQLRDVTNQQNGAGPAPTEFKGSRITENRLVEYSDSEDDVLKAPKPKSAPSQRKAATVLAAEPAPRTHHMFDDEATSASEALVNTSSQQDGKWVSEKESSLGPYDPKRWKAERRYIRFPRYTPTFPTTSGSPDIPMASTANSEATTGVATSSTDTNRSISASDSHNTSSNRSITTSNATTNTTNHSIRSTLTEKELQFLPRNQISVTDGARCTDPPHLRGRREGRLATETSAAGANAARVDAAGSNAAQANTARFNAARSNAARSNAARANAPRANADGANAARSDAAGSNAAGLTGTSSQSSQNNSSPATSGPGVAGGPGTGPSRTQTASTTAATTATGVPRTSTEGMQKSTAAPIIFVRRPKDFYSR